VIISDQVVDYEVQFVTDNEPEIRYSVHRADPTLLNAVLGYRSRDWEQLIQSRRPGKGSPQRKNGPIATGDKVIGAADMLKRYQSDWPKLIGIEMESGGVASACFQSPSPPGFFMVRAISDHADKAKNSPRVRKWREYACDVASAYAIGLLRSGPVLPLYGPSQKRSNAELELEQRDSAQEPLTTCNDVISVTFVLDCLVGSFDDTAFRNALAVPLRIDGTHIRIVEVRPVRQRSVVVVEGDPSVIARIIKWAESSSGGMRAFAKTTGLAKVEWMRDGNLCEVNVSTG
jgi:hypothetical protein